MGGEGGGGEGAECKIPRKRNVEEGGESPIKNRESESAHFEVLSPCIESEARLISRVYDREMGQERRREEGMEKRGREKAAKKRRARSESGWT